ncbi:hypothetical protein fugu_001947 [Takifugu bimaculatus]|uniref:Uncharacterized protein n=1 Tax=Takifugu bimaculatus TaxID=433685 RepID=A0A4Z2BN98_9TELE|nr:hypothetical protein fugu_001947 [Takifugu bimaculatus]
MSRRKQKRPQHLVNADPGGPVLLTQDEHLAMKSPSTSLGSDITSSGSSSSSPASLQDCQPPLAPRPSPGLPPRYLHEKSSNTSSFAHSNGISFPTPPLPTASHSQDLQPSSSLGSASSLGRPQHHYQNKCTAAPPLALLREEENDELTMTSLTME